MKPQKKQTKSSDLHLRINPDLKRKLNHNREKVQKSVGIRVTLSEYVTMVLEKMLG